MYKITFYKLNDTTKNSVQYHLPTKTMMAMTEEN